MSVKALVQRLPAPRDGAVQGLRASARTARSSARSTGGAGTSTGATRSSTRPTASHRETMRPDDIRLQECRSRGLGRLRVDQHGSTTPRRCWRRCRRSRRRWMPSASPTCACTGGRRPILNANWKVAQEAFHEGWHVMATHPQLTMGMGEDWPFDNVEYTAFPGGHARFQRAVRHRSGRRGTGPRTQAFLARSRALWEGQDAMVLERDLRVFEGMLNKVPDGRRLPHQGDRRAIRLRRRRRHPDVERPRGHQHVGRAGIRLPELLRTASVCERAVLPGPPVQRRSGVVPFRGVVAHHVPRGLSNSGAPA